MPTKDPGRLASGTPLITVEPTEVGFGAVEVGTTGDPVRTIYIRNTNGTNLVINGTDILGANAGDFSLVDPIPVTGTELDPNGTYELQVAFSPTANGTRVAELGFDVVGRGATLPTVDLSGTGVQQPPTNQPGTRGCTIIGTNNGEVLTGTRAATSSAPEAAPTVRTASAAETLSGAALATTAW